MDFSTARKTKVALVDHLTEHGEPTLYSAALCPLPGWLCDKGLLQPCRDYRCAGSFRLAREAGFDDHCRAASPDRGALHLDGPVADLTVPEL